MSVLPAEPTLVSRFTRFGLVSAASLGLNLGLTWLMHGVLGWAAEAAFAVALVVVFVGNFALMRFWVYRHARGDHETGTQFRNTVMVSVGFRVAEYGAFLLLHTLAGVHYLASIVAVMVATNLAKFLVYHYLVFGRRRSR